MARTRREAEANRAKAARLAASRKERQAERDAAEGRVDQLIAEARARRGENHK